MGQCFITRRGSNTTTKEPTLVLENSIILEIGLANKFGKKSLKEVSAINVGNFVYFAGGGAGTKKTKFQNSGGSKEYNNYVDSHLYSNIIATVDVERMEISALNATLPIATKNLAAAKTDKHIIFAGGSYFDKALDAQKASISDKAYIYTQASDGTLQLAGTETMLQTRQDPIAVTLGDFVIVGGMSLRTPINQLDIFYDNPINHQIVKQEFNLDEATVYTSAVTVGNYAVFFGFIKENPDSNGYYKPIIDIFRDAETRITLDNERLNLTFNSNALKSVVVGDYIITAGKYNGVSDIENPKHGYFDIFKKTENSFVSYEHDFMMDTETNPKYLNAAYTNEYAIFYGGNSSVFYVFYVDNNNQLKMTKYKSDMISHKLAAVGVGNKLICLEGHPNNRPYRISSYIFKK